MTGDQQQGKSSRRRKRRGGKNSHQSKNQQSSDDVNQEGGKFKQTTQKKKNEKGPCENMQENGSNGRAKKGNNRHKSRNRASPSDVNQEEGNNPHQNRNQSSPCDVNEKGGKTKKNNRRKNNQGGPPGRNRQQNDHKGQMQDGSESKKQNGGQRTNEKKTLKGRLREQLLKESLPGYEKKIRRGGGAQGDRRLAVRRPRKKLSDSWNIKEFEERIQFIGSGLKVAYTEGPKSNQTKIDWLAHKTPYEEELKHWAKHHGGLKEGPKSVLQEIHFKNINGDMAFQIMCNMPSTAFISFGTDCLLFFNYATETKLKKEKLSAFRFVEPVKYIGFIDSSKADEKNPEVIQITKDFEVRVKCGLHLLFETPISSQTVKMLMTECADAETMSFGDICYVEFKTEKDARSYEDELKHLRLKNETQRISYEQLSVCCVDPENIEENPEDKPRKRITKAKNLRLLENEIDKKNDNTIEDQDDEKREVKKNMDALNDDEFATYEDHTSQEKIKESEMLLVDENDDGDEDDDNDNDGDDDDDNADKFSSGEVQARGNANNAEKNKRTHETLDDEYAKCEKSMEKVEGNKKKLKILDDDDEYNICESKAIKQRSIESLKKSRRLLAIDDDEFSIHEIQVSKQKEEDGE